MYVFNMQNGKKKLAYGETPDDAYENLRLRLTDKELNLVVKADAIRINQREMRNYIHQLG
jgi:hypothetical protein